MEFTSLVCLFVITYFSYQKNPIGLNTRGKKSRVVVSECFVGSVEQDKHFKSRVMENLDSRNHHLAASVITKYFIIYYITTYYFRMKLVLEQGLLELAQWKLSVPVPNLLLCQMTLRKIVPGQKLHTGAMISRKNTEILMEAATVLQAR